MGVGVYSPTNNVHVPQAAQSVSLTKLLVTCSRTRNGDTQLANGITLCAYQILLLCLHS